MSLRKAVNTAADADAESDDIGSVVNSSARGGVRSGVRVRIVTSEGENGTATVVTDAEEGELLALELDAAN